MSVDRRTTWLAAVSIISKPIGQPPHTQEQGPSEGNTPTPAPTCICKQQLLHACHSRQQLHQLCAGQHKPSIPTRHQPAQRPMLDWRADAKQRQLLLLMLLLRLSNTC
jgi:hypothetical protein